MHDFMVKLAGFLGRRRRLVLLAWVAVVALALPFALNQTDHLTGGGFDVPGSESKAVSDSLQRDFAEETGGITVLLRAEPGAGAAAEAAAIGRVRRAVAGLDETTLPAEAVRRARVSLRSTGSALLPLRSEQSADRQTDSATILREDLALGVAEGGVTTYLAGQPTVWAGLQELSKEDLSKAEAAGFPIVALILLVVFGSLAAAVLPLTLGFVSVIVTGALIYFLSLQMSTSVFVTNMASMIGIGVAIDYSLFILARYREERAKGRDPDAARSEALATSGLAVTFSGLAVIVSLAGLWMVDNQALRSMALGAMTVVAVSILTATTLLPVLIAMLGDRVMPGGVVAKVLGIFRRRGERPDREAFWVRWTGRVMAHPWVAVIGVSAVLLTLAAPLLSVETGTGALEQFPKDSDVRVGNELVAKQLGGAADPVQVVASFDDPNPSRADRVVVLSFSHTLAATPGIDSVGPPLYAGGDVLVQATPSAPSESDATRALIGRLRDSVIPATALSKVATVDVGGETARSDDARAQINGSMWKIVLFVLALSFLVLVVMLRSLLLPLKAVLMNLLSIGAAFGV
ncbi:MAG TPA: MMPL family transporter, partial [Solirubrobacterales bacterium]